MAKKLSEFTELLTNLQDSDRILIARPGQSVDYYTTVLALKNHINTEGNGGGGSGNISDPDAIAFLTSLSGTYSVQEEEAVDAFVVALKDRTISAGGSQWDSLTEFWLCAADSSSDGLVGMKGNFALQTLDDPTFTPREGFKLNGSSQALFSSINPSLLGSERKGICGAYTRLSSDNSCVIFSWEDGGSYFLEHYGDNGEEVEYLSFFGGAYGAFISTDYVEHKGASTVSYQSSCVIGFNDLAQENIDLALIDLPDVSNIYWGRYSEGSSNASSDDQYASCWVGIEDKGWTEAETIAFHADIETLLDAFGAGVIG